METQYTYIPTLDAAAIAGSTADTIRNLCKAGVLRHKKRNQLYFPCKEDVELYAQTIAELSELEHHNEECNNSINKLHEQLRLEQQEALERLEALKMSTYRINHIIELLCETSPFITQEFGVGELRTAMELLRGGKRTDDTEKKQLTYGRAVQIYELSINTLKHFPEYLQEQERAIEDRDQQIVELKRMVKERYEGVHGDEAVISLERQQLLQKSIYDIDFSVRTMNALNSAEIATIGGLIKWRRADLLKFRNFGKSSLAEIEDWLEAHGLALAE